MSERPKSGYYWCYTFADDGRRIQDEGKPDICYYDAADNTTAIVGSEVIMYYCPEVDQLLQLLEYQPPVSGT